SANGWAIDVVMRDVAKLRSRDLRRLDQLPPRVRVYSAVETEPWLARMESGMLRVVRSFRSRAGAGRAKAPATNGQASTNGSARPRKKHWLVHAHASIVHVERERAWGSAAIETGVALGRANRYDVVVSSGPPHMVHDTARTVARRLEVPHVMD